MSDFLAEARILVRPDTTAFRGLLEAELRASLAKPVTVPVVPVVAGGGLGAAAAQTSVFTTAQVEAAAATQGVAAELEKETIAVTQATVSTKGLGAAQTAAAGAAQKLAFAQSEVIGASSAVNAAQITLTRSTAAVSAAQTAVGLALAKNNAELIASTEATLALASAQQTAAAAALADARAQAALAATQAQAVKGIVAQSAATLGLRAGTLAASSAFIVATVGVLAFVKAVKSAADFATELKVFEVNASATADQMERVSAAAKQLGRDVTLPGVTAATAATAMTELAKAGLSVEDSVNGARGALQLATAAQIDITTSTKLVANTLNAFGLAGTDAVNVADLLAGAAKSAQGEIGEFGTGLQQVASVADQFGVSAQDTVTLLTQLAKAGLQGGRAGTTLRVAILGLIKPTAAAAVELDKLQKAGVQITKPNGAFNPKAFAQINTALKNYSKEQQNVIRNTIFSSDAIKVLGRATAGGVEDFNKINAAVGEAGLSLEASSARTQGLDGATLNLSNQVSALGLVVGEVSQGPLTSLVTILGGVVGAAATAAEGMVSLKKKIDGINDSGAFDGINSFFEGLGKKLAIPIPKQLEDLRATVQGLAKDMKEAASSADGLKGVLDQIDVGKTFGLTFLPASVPDVGLGVKQIQNIITGFDAQEVRAKIAGDNAKLIDVLNTEQAFLERQLTRDYVKRRPALRRLIEQALLGTVNDIESVQSQASTRANKVEADAKKAAADAAAAIRDREQALLSSFGVARDEQANKIAAAAQTAGLKDDIREQKDLATLVRAQIAAVRERISVEGGRRAAVVALRAILIQVKGALKGVKDAQQAVLEEQRQNLLRRVSLDIELAEITGNQAAEVAARNKKLKVLETALLAEAKLHGKNTVAYKEIRNEIARERAAIEEIRKEKQESNQSFAQASFEFLQAQQGFASNLLGNLIPSGATGGLVGNVQTALAPVAGMAEGRSMSGPTAGQGNATNSLLVQILNQLKEMNGETKAPQARRQRTGQQSLMDGDYGG